MNIGLLNNLLNEKSVQNDKNLNNSLHKLSSGLRINKAADDASGLAIADKLRTQASGIKQGIENSNSAVAMLNIADKSMSEMSNILDIIKTKALQMATDTTSEEGRKAIKSEILKLIDNYNNIVSQTNYNQIPLLDGSRSPFEFLVGPDSPDIISVDIDSVESKYMGQADPYKLANFISGFNEVSATSTVDESSLAGQSGVVRVNFDWEESLEIDGYVVQPDGTVIGWDSSSYFTGFEGISNFVAPPNTTNLGGEVDIVTSPDGNENHVWTDFSDGLNGEWQVFVRNFSQSWPDNQPIDITVSIVLDGEITQINVPIPTTAETDYTNGLVPVTTFNYSTSNNSTSSAVRNDDSPTLLIQAQKLLAVIDESLNQLNSVRSNIGAGTNQLESSTRNMMTDYVNIKNAEGIIRDVDYAQESANLNKSMIISQAGSYAQTQASQVDQKMVSDLLK